MKLSAQRVFISYNKVQCEAQGLDLPHSVSEQTTGKFRSEQIHVRVSTYFNSKIDKADLVEIVTAYS